MDPVKCMVAELDQTSKQAPNLRTEVPKQGLVILGRHVDHIYICIVDVPPALNQTTSIRKSFHGRFICVEIVSS